ncbi:HET domain-containing protein [Microdochium nivale]|nr:HET domain-containing protein [Microdochium nivale]
MFPAISSRSENLCARCAKLDLESLVTAPWLTTNDAYHTQTARPATDFEIERSVYIDDFSLKDSQSRTTLCRLCRLLAECARMTGAEEALLGAHCCIRPKLVWTKQPSQVAAALEQSSSPQLLHSGQLYVWFHELKRNPKAARPRVPTRKPRRNRLGSLLRPGRLGRSKDEDHDSSEAESDNENDEIRDSGQTSASGSAKNEQTAIADAIIKSALDSWRIDIIGKAFNGQRAIIPPRIDLDMLKAWFGRCDAEHSHLMASGEVTARLGSIRDAGLFRAINTTTGKLEAPSRHESFAVLSYVWGLAPSYVHKHESAQHGVRSYAPTLRDAAQLAKAVGINWLWVDRVCIDQENDKEKAALIPYIKDVFAGADLTIVAAGGDGAHAGLPGSPDTPRQPARTFDFALDLGKDHMTSLTPATHSFNTLNNASVWHTRGWTFEEYVFSRRLLYVFPSEVIFSCSTGTFRESTGQHFVNEPAGSTWGDSGSTPPSVAARLQAQFNSSRSHKDIVSLPDYMRAVEEYTARELSVEEDRVGAFAGLVAAAIGAAEHGIAEQALLRHGHPLPYFEPLLTWQHMLQYDAHGPKEQQNVRQPAFGKPFVPSWSWASAGMKVQFLDKSSQRRTTWFDFTTIGETHILGIPTYNMIREMMQRLNMHGPQEIIDRRPWVSFISQPTPSHTDNSNASHSAEQSLESTTLPQLHLVTVVFTAYLYYSTDQPRRLILQEREKSVGEDNTFASSIIEHWSIAPVSRASGSSSMGKRRSFWRSRDKTVHATAPLVPVGFAARRLGEFCIVAGLGHFYIMALAEVLAQLPPPYASTQGAVPGDSAPLLASRLGLCRISQVADQGSLMDIMAAGGASWRHICIV